MGIAWGCQTRADLLDEKTVKAMASANCKYIDLGIESFDQRILDDVKKDLDVPAALESVRLVKKYGLDTKINILFGASPLETIDTINATMRMVKKMRVDQVMYSICTPWPGTEMYDRAKKEGWFVYGDYRTCDNDRESIIQFPHLSKKELEKAIRRANRTFFLNPRFILKNIFTTGIFNFSNIKDSIRAVINKIR